MIYLLGIDDTDDSISRGTGYQARRLGEAIQTRGLAKFHAATRHQLLVDSRIDYTSRNSSVCVVLEVTEQDISHVFDFAATELGALCAPNSNAGIAMAERSMIDIAIQGFGRDAKQEVLHESPTRVIANERQIQLRRISGTGLGIIGALAALGLHASGNDGRFIWLPKLRELSGTYTVDDYVESLGVEVSTAEGEPLSATTEIEATEWMRPIMRDGRAILLVEEETVDDEIRWRFIDKPTVKALSD